MDLEREQHQAAVGGLHHSTSYVFALAAINAAGVGPYSSPSRPMATLGAPTAVPYGVRCSDATLTSLHVSWAAPRVPPDSAPVLSYLVKVSSPGQPDRVVEKKVDGEVTDTVVEGLEAHTRYIAVVHGVNAVGVGAASSACAPTWTLGPPSVQPAPPTPGDATTDSVEVSFLPTALGPHDHPITGYILLWRTAESDSNAGYSGSMAVPKGLTNARATGLRPGTQYVFAVQATNPVGKGPVGTPSTPKQTLGKPSRAPGAPSYVRRSEVSMELQWDDCPLDDDDAPLTG